MRVKLGIKSGDEKKKTRSKETELAWKQEFAHKLPSTNWWIKGLIIDPTVDILFTWNEDMEKGNNKTMIYQMYKNEEIGNSFKMLAEFDDLASQEDQITDMLCFSSMNYFIVATHFGNLMVYKWDRANKRRFVHTYKGHSKAVPSMKPIKNKSTNFVSASLDGTIRIWCLDKLIELYCFDIGNALNSGGSGISEVITGIKLLNDKVFAV